MVNWKLIGGVLAFVFAALTGVFVWLADRESGDTESKEYKGYYTGAMVSGFLCLVSAVGAFASWYMSTPELNAVEPEVPKGALNVAGEQGEEAAAIAGSAPDAQEIAKAALAGENTEALMSRAKELKQAGEAAVAKAEVARVTAEQAAATAGNQAAAARQNVTEAAVKAAANQAQAQASAEALKALSAAETQAKAAESQTLKTAVAQEAAARIVRQNAGTKTTQAERLLKALPLFAAVGGGAKS